MNNKEIIKQLGVIAESIEAIKTTLSEGESVMNEPVQEKKVEKPKKEAVKKESSSDDVTVKSLEEMGYNDLKKYAASVGVSATGKRDDIIARILDVGVQNDEDKEPVKKEESTKKKSNKIVNIEDKRAEKEFEDTADDILEENDLEDVISELKEVGMKGVTKKNVRDKLIEALKEDLIDLEDDEDDEESADEKDEAEEIPDEEEDDEGDEVIDNETYFEDFDPEGVNNPKNVKSKDRLKAMMEIQEDILDSIEANDLDEAIMKSFLLENSTEDEQEEIEEFDEDEVMAAYIELRKRMVDDDGDDMSDTDDAYYVNDIVYGHGRECKETDGEYVDEVSGETFEI